MRRLVLAVAVGGAIALGPVAIAAPADLSLMNQVPSGKKPTINLTATEAITSITLDVERVEDHRAFHSKFGPLAAGNHTEIPIGDGKGGRAHWKGKLVIHAASGDSTSAIDFESNVGGAGGGLKI